MRGERNRYYHCSNKGTGGANGTCSRLYPSVTSTEKSHCAQASIMNTRGLRALVLNEDTTADMFYQGRDLLVELASGTDIRIATMSPQMLGGTQMAKLLGDTATRKLI